MFHEDKAHLIEENRCSRPTDVPKLLEQSQAISSIFNSFHGTGCASLLFFMLQQRVC